MTVRVYPPEVAGPMIGKSAHWMKRNAQKGLIPCRKVGRTLGFTDADLDKIVEDSAVPPVTAAAQASAPRRPRRKAVPPAAGQAAPLIPKPPKQRGTAARAVPASGGR